MPADAIVTFAGLEKVFVVEKGKAVEKQVSTGRRGTNWVEIVSGVNSGETVVLSPGNLQTGENVKVERATTETTATNNRS